MKVILLKNIKGTGKAFEIKEVSGGFARNFLLPKNLARIADPESILKLEKEKAAWQKAEESEKETLLKKVEIISGKEFIFRVKTGKKGEVFGSIVKEDIKKKLLAETEGLYKDDLEIMLGKPIKALGGYDIPIELGRGVEAKIKIRVLAEEE
ncbi:MAG: 50S ribosomal protein L9 [Candidatus Wolfebacteria bacterium]|nr:50S ribosomal protein L9 [Candidatus Wolfebacteria bacterium]